MKVFTTVKEIQQEIWKEKSHGRTIGFIPTMGFLHEGHLTLIKKARQENDLVVVSIFVNPLQFGPKEDFSEYPRDFARDRALAEREFVDFLFYPSTEEMYPNEPLIKMTVQKRTDVLCGKSRPGHFDGVATVVAKLFSITMPTRAYFGKKDAQQVAVIESLVNDFNFPIELRSIDIVREEDGLAKSSRNVKLLPEERQQAPVLFKSLQAAKQAIDKGERRPSVLIDLMRNMITDESEGQIDYVEIYSYPQLEPLTELTGKCIVALAVKFSKVRLIDNLILDIN